MPFISTWKHNPLDNKGVSIIFMQIRWPIFSKSFSKSFHRFVSIKFIFWEYWSLTITNVSSALRPNHLFTFSLARVCRFKILQLIVINNTSFLNSISSQVVFSFLLLYVFPAIFNNKPLIYSRLKETRCFGLDFTSRTTHGRPFCGVKIWNPQNGRPCFFAT